jgi:hypothetical protein
MFQSQAFAPPGHTLQSLNLWAWPLVVTSICPQHMCVMMHVLLSLIGFSLRFLVLNTMTLLDGLPINSKSA